MPRTPPFYFWMVASLTLLSIVGFFGQSHPVGVNWGGAVIELLLLVGLAVGSQLCRWFLLITALGGAIVLFGNLTEGVALGDAVLLAACVAQVVLLSTSTMRAYTDRHPQRPLGDL